MTHHATPDEEDSDPSRRALADARSLPRNDPAQDDSEDRPDDQEQDPEDDYVPL